MSGNPYLLNITQTAFDALTAFNQPYKDNTQFIFFDNTENKGLQQVFKLSQLADHGLTLSLLSFDKPDQICLDHITNCRWCIDGIEYTAKFENSALNDFEVIFTNRGQFSYVRNMITNIFNLKPSAFTKRE